MKRAVDEANREIREGNRKARQAVVQHNNNVRQAVANHNNEVRAYNARVRANRQRLQSAILQYNARSSQARYVTVQQSVTSLRSAYERLEERAEAGSYGAEFNELLDLSERETANSFDAYNALEEDQESEQESDEEDTVFLGDLSSMSADYAARWEGAVYSLSPKNPDAARHFCTSSREILISLIETNAPDDEVIKENPNYSKHVDGRPDRRSKIQFILGLRGLKKTPLSEFVDHDVDDILKLITEFNRGTHGSAGKFSLGQLLQLKRRVRDGIGFVVTILKQATLA